MQHYIAAAVVAFLVFIAIDEAGVFERGASYTQEGK